MRIEPLLPPPTSPSASPLANGTTANATGSEAVARVADGYAGATAVRSPFAPPLLRGMEVPAPVLPPMENAAQVGAEIQRSVAGRLLGVAGLALVSLGALAGCTDVLPPPPAPATSQAMQSPITHQRQANVAQVQSHAGADEWGGALPPGGYYSGDSYGTQAPTQSQGGYQGRTTWSDPAQHDDDSGALPPGGYYSDPQGGGSVWGPDQGKTNRYVPPQDNANPGYIPGQVPAAPTQPVTPRVVVPRQDPVAPPQSPMVPPTTVPPRVVPSYPMPVNPGATMDAGDLQQQPNESFNDFMQRMMEAKQNALRQAQQNRPTTPTDPNKPNQAKTSVTVTAHGYWEGNDYHGVKEIRIWEVNNYQNRTSNTYTSYGTPASQSLSLNTAQPGKTCRVQVTWEGGVSRTYDVPADASGNPTSFDAWKY